MVKIVIIIIIWIINGIITFLMELLKLVPKRFPNCKISFLMELVANVTVHSGFRPRPALDPGPPQQGTVLLPHNKGTPQNDPFGTRNSPMTIE